MGIKSELHEAIVKRGGKVPPYGGIAAAMDELNKLPGGSGGIFFINLTFDVETMAITGADKSFAEIEAAIKGGSFPVVVIPIEGINYASLGSYVPDTAVQFGLIIQGSMVNITYNTEQGWYMG